MSVNALTYRASQKVNCIKTAVSIENPITHETTDTLGIWDTGATNSCITSALAKKLNLVPIQKAIVTGVHGAQEVNVYWVYITLNNQNITVSLLATEASELSDDHATGMLIGMDVINKGDFCITNYENKTLMSFRIPSLEDVDFVSEIAEFNRISKLHKIQKKKGIERCPCGSGKLYKNCCGNNKYNR